FCDCVKSLPSADAHRDGHGRRTRRSIGDPSISDRYRRLAHHDSSYLAPSPEALPNARACTPSTYTLGSSNTVSFNPLSSNPVGRATSLPSSARATASTLAPTPNSPPLARTSTVPPSLFTSVTPNPSGSARFTSASLTSPSTRTALPCLCMLVLVSLNDPSSTLSALTSSFSTPFASFSSATVCPGLTRNRPARTRTSSASPHNSFTAGHAFTSTLFTVPCFSIFPRTILAAIPGPNACASTTPATIPPTTPPATRITRRLPLPVRTISASHFRVDRAPCVLALNLPLGRVAQLARAPRLHRGGRPFESGRAHPTSADDRPPRSPP